MKDAKRDKESFFKKIKNKIHHNIGDNQLNKKNKTLLMGAIFGVTFLVVLGGQSYYKNQAPKQNGLPTSIQSSGKHVVQISKSKAEDFEELLNGKKIRFSKNNENVYVIERSRVEQIEETIRAIDKKSDTSVAKDAPFLLMNASSAPSAYPKAETNKIKNSPNLHETLPKGKTWKELAIERGQKLVAVIDANVENYAIHNEDFTNQLKNENIQHGTLVAQTIHEESNGHAMILGLKAFDEHGIGYMSDVLEAIQYAREQKVDIINLSFTTDANKNTKVFDSVIKNCLDEGITVVVAAGNCNQDIRYYTPANINGVISVGALDSEGNKQTDSNYGNISYYIAARSTSEAAAKISASIARNDDLSGLKTGKEIQISEGDHIEHTPIFSENKNGDFELQSSVQNITISSGGKAELNITNCQNGTTQYPKWTGDGKYNLGFNQYMAASSIHDARGKYGYRITSMRISGTRAYGSFPNIDGPISVGAGFVAGSNTVISISTAPWQHTVAYNANGGTGAPGNQTKTYGSHLYISNTIPKRDGFKFIGWNTRQDGGGTSYSPGQNYTPDQNGGTVTLYAQWQGEPQKINYDLQGGYFDNKNIDNPNGYKILEDGMYTIQWGYDSNYYLHTKSSDGNTLGFHLWEGPGSISDESDLNTVFYFERYKNTPYYYIRTRNGNDMELAGVINNVTSNSAISESTQEIGVADHLWYFKDMGNGRLGIGNKATNHYLYASYRTPENGNGVGQYGDSNGADCQWIITQKSTGMDSYAYKRKGRPYYVNSKIPKREGYKFLFYSSHPNIESTGYTVYPTNITGVDRIYIEILGTNKYNVFFNTTDSSITAVQLPHWRKNIETGNNAVWTGMSKGNFLENGESYNWKATIDRSSVDQVRGWDMHVYITKNGSRSGYGGPDLPSTFGPEKNYSYDQDNIVTTLYASWEKNIPAQNVIFDLQGGHKNNTISNPNNYVLIEDGDYYVKASANPEYLIRPIGDSKQKTTNLELSKKTDRDEFASHWTFERYKNTPYYIITSTQAAYTVSAPGANVDNNSKIQIYNTYTSKGEATSNIVDSEVVYDAQWYFTRNANGSLTIHNRYKGSQVWDITNGKVEEGTVLEFYQNNNTVAQQFILEPVEGQTGDFYTKKKINQRIMWMPTDTPVKGNAPFLGWNTEPNGTGKMYKTGDAFTEKLEAPITLYAQWGEDTSTHEHLFNPNGGHLMGNDQIFRKHGEPLNFSDGYFEVTSKQNHYDMLGSANYNFGNKATVVGKFSSNTTTPNSNGTIIANYEGAGIGLHQNPSNQIEFTIHANGAYHSVQGPTIQQGRIYWVAGTYDGTTAKLYVDGQLVASKSLSGNITTSKMNFYLGGNPDPNGASEVLNGRIYKGAVYFDALSAQDIMTIYQMDGGSSVAAKPFKYKSWDVETPYRENFEFAGWFTEPQGGTQVTDSTLASDRDAIYYAHWIPNHTLRTSRFDSNGGTLLGNDVINVPVDAPIQYSQGYQEFTGKGSQSSLGLSNYNFGNQITMFAKFNIGNHTISSYESLVANWEAGGSGIGIYPDGRIRWEAHIGGAYQLVFGPVIQKNTDYFAVATYDGVAMRLYLNGQLVGTKAIIGTIKPSPVPIMIGANPSEDTAYHESNFIGKMYKAGVYRQALSEQEVQKMYTTKELSSISKMPLAFKNWDIETPKQDGMQFDGWYTDPVGGTKISNSYVQMQPEQTYYAHWLGMPQTLTFNPNGGKLFGNDTLNRVTGENINYSQGYQTFDGVDDAIVLRGAEYPNMATVGTLSAKFEVEEITPGKVTIFGNYADQGIEVYLNNGTLTARISINGQDYTPIFGRVKENTPYWVHFVQTPKSPQKVIYTMYMNKSNISSREMSPGIISSTNPFIVGGEMNSSGVITNQFKGKIYKVAAYSSALTRDEIYTLIDNDDFSSISQRPEVYKNWDIETPTMMGQRFTGWYTDPIGGNKITDLSKVPNNNSIYYAHWGEPVATQTVRARYENADGTFTDYRVVHEENVAIGTTFTWEQPETKMYQRSTLNYVVDGERSTDVTVYRRKYRLLVQGRLDKIPVPSVNAIATFDFQLGQEPSTSGQVGVDVTVRYGTDYSVTNIVPQSGYTYVGATPPIVGTVEDETTVNLDFEKQNVKIQFESNGGVEADPKQVFKKFGEEIGPLAKTYRRGYRFLGWFTASNGGTKVDEHWIVPDKDTTLYAHWEANTYTVHYDGNGHTVINPDDVASMPDSEHVYGQEKALNKNLFTRQAWEFVGWNTESDGSGTPYKDEEVVKNLTSIDKGTVTLYAQWQPKGFRVVFHPNGGETPQPFSEKEGVQGEPIGTFPTTKRKGYTFDGWYSSVEIDAPKVTEDTIIIEKLTNVYAHWKINSYQISYDYAGGEVQNNPQEYDVNTSTFTLKNPTRKGYKFEGWTGSNGNLPQMNVTISKGTVGNLHYKANWSPATYFVHYDGNGATSGSMNDSIHLYGEPKALNKNTYKNSGLDFIEWNTQRDGGGISYSDQEVVENLTDVNDSTVTLYAIWQKSTVTITWNGNGGIHPIPTTGVCGAQIGQLPTTKREGYEFVGWFTKANGGTEITEQSIIPNENVTYYAHWKAQEYKIHYDLNGGTATGNPKTYTIETPTFSLNEPTRKGYKFIGWSGTGIDSITKNVVIQKGSTGDRSYTANWEGIRYSIRYDGNGATSGTMGNTHHQYGVAKTLQSNAYSRTGYTFLGWNTKPDGTGTDYQNNQNVLNLTAKDGDTVILYAQWKIKKYTVTFNPNMDASSNTVTIYAGTREETLSRPDGTTYTDESGGTRTKYVITFNKADIDKGLLSVSIKGLFPAFDGTIRKVESTKTSLVDFDATTITKVMTFDANGGTCDAEPVRFQVGSKPKSLPIPKREGYEFDGWFTAPSGGTEITLNTTLGDDDLTVYAHWIAKTYEIKYYGNGGLDHDSDILSDKVHWKEDYAIRANSYSRSGYKFIGWNTEPDGSGKDYSGKIGISESWTLDENLSLYAQWKRIR